MLRQQKETVVKASRAYQDEVKKAYPGVPLHQVGTMIENDANEVAYNRKYRDYLLKETKEAATRTLNIEKRIEELRKNVRRSLFHPVNISATLQACFIMSNVIFGKFHTNPIVERESGP